MSRTPVIVGVAESDLGITGKTHYELQAQAVSRALAEAGLDIRDVDGYCTSDLAGEYAPSIRMSEYLGITPRYFGNSSLGGASFVSQVADAGRAIRDRRADVVVVAYARAPRTAAVQGVSARPVGPAQYERIWGAPFPVTGYALAAARYMHEHKASSIDLANVAVSTRRWAELNPVAFNRDPLDVEKVLSSRMIAEPLHKLDCCLVTDGGGAVVLTSLDRARDLPRKPIHLLGHGEATTHMNVTSSPDITVTSARSSAATALRESGTTFADIDLFEIYDSFTITVLLTMESMGLCEPGEAPEWFATGRTAPGGDRPVNTNGGGLSFGHPGEYGIFAVIEAVRQLQGSAGDRQVSGAELALVNGTGGELSVSSTLILGGRAA